MADPGVGLPNTDPLTPEFTVDGLIDFLNSPPLEDLTIQEPISHQDPIFTQPNPIPEQGNEIGHNSNIWGTNSGFYAQIPGEPSTPNHQFQFQSQNFTGFSQESGPSEIPGESSDPDEYQIKSGNYKDTILISQWPPNPVPFYCTCCQVLREIFHTNGMEFTTLELHGRKGNIHHGILDIKVSTDSDTESHFYQMFDFTNKTLEDVKQFMIQYCIERKEKGFFIINDPMSSFYETLCIGFSWAESLYHTNEFQPTSSNQVPQSSSQGGEGNPSKVPLSIQRQRTGKMKVKDIKNFFHLPIEQAAKRMRICPTVVKKICRRDGLSRWPHRKIKSLEKQMANWAALMGVTDPEVRIRALSEITRIEREMDRIKATGRSEGDNQNNQGAGGSGNDNMMIN